LPINGGDILNLNGRIIELMSGEKDVNIDENYVWFVGEYLEEK